MQGLSGSLSSLFRLAATRAVACAWRRAGPGRGRGPGPVFERVTGPVKGYHTAAYARETHPGSGCYLAFYKVCDGAPRDYWVAHCLFKGAAPGVHASPIAALAAADGQASLAIGNLPSLERLRDLDPVGLFRFIGLDQWPLPSPLAPLAA